MIWECIKTMNPTNLSAGRKIIQPLIFVLLTPLVGCNFSGASGGDGSQGEATVKGTVKVKGKLMSGGTLHFSVISPQRMVAPHDAQISANGTYTVKAVVGQNYVTLSPPRKTRADAKNRDYFGLEYVEKPVQVKPGDDNVLDLDMTP